MVIGPMRRKDTGGLLAEDFCEVIVVAGDRRSWILTGRGRGLGLGSHGLWCRYQRKTEELALLDGSLKGSGADERDKRGVAGLGHGGLHRWMWSDRWPARTGTRQGRGLGLGLRLGLGL